MRRLLLCLIFGGCSLAWAAPPLHDVLLGVGRAVEDFWERFAVVDCTETVSQEKLDKDGKVIGRKDSAYDYVVLTRKQNQDLVVEESRVLLRSAGKDKNQSLLVTNGFSALLFVFHPNYQGSFEYSQPIDDEVDGRKVLQLRFRLAHGGRSPSCLRLRGHDYPLEWAGTAWIDPQSDAVVKISAALGSAMEDVGVQALTAEVRYAPVRFSGASREEWLPSVAVIAARTPRQRWQNTHRFTDYKQFTVDTKTKTEAPKQANSQSKEE